MWQRSTLPAGTGGAIFIQLSQPDTVGSDASGGEPWVMAGKMFLANGGNGGNGFREVFGVLS